MKNFLRAVIYTQFWGLILPLANHHMPGDTIRAYRAPVYKFFSTTTQALVFQDCQLVDSITCVLLLPISLNLGKKNIAAVISSRLPGSYS